LIREIGKIFVKELIRWVNLKAGGESRRRGNAGGGQLECLKEKGAVG